jgi:hypothetical protein
MSIVQLQGHQFDLLTIVEGRAPNNILVAVSGSAESPGSLLGTPLFWHVKAAFFDVTLNVARANKVIIDQEEGAGFVLDIVQVRNVVDGTPDANFRRLPDGVHVCWVSLSGSSGSSHYVARSFATLVARSIPVVDNNISLISPVSP